MPHYKGWHSKQNTSLSPEGYCWVTLVIDTLDLFVGNVNSSENAIQQDKSPSPTLLTSRVNDSASRRHPGRKMCLPMPMHVPMWSSLLSRAVSFSLEDGACI